MFPISQNTTTAFTGVVYQQFLAFSQPITIYKEPIKNIVSVPTNYLYGYDESQTQNTEVTLTSVSAIHSGMTIYPLKVKNSQASYIDNKIILNPNNIYIKLNQAGRDYIMDGRKNEKLEFDGLTWNFTEANKYQVQSFLSLLFYYFEVKATN